MAVKVGEKALVLKDAKHTLTAEETFTSLTFLESVTLSNSVDGTADFSSTGDTYFNIHMNLSYGSFSVMIEGETMFGDIYYESSDGLTYTLRDFRVDNFETGESITGPTVDFGVEMQLNSTSCEEILNFFPVGDVNFDGIYVVKEQNGIKVWGNQEIGINTTAKQIAPGYKAYTNNGVIEGALGESIDSNEDLWLIDNIIKNVNLYQPETLHMLYYKYTGDTIPSAKLLDTKKYNNLSYMFSNAKSSIIDVSNFEFTSDALTTYNEWFLARMFADNPNLKQVIGFNEMITKMKEVSNSSTKWDTDCLFATCASFEDKETVKNFDTTIITKPYFYECPNIEVDATLWYKPTIVELQCSKGVKKIEGFANAQLTALTSMRFIESLITEVDFSNTNMPVLSTLDQAFSKCSNLKTANFKDFNAPLVNSFSMMFNSCPLLETVDLSSSDKIYSVKYTGCFKDMFLNCSKLTSANLRGIDITPQNSSIKPWADNMFSGCTSLQFCDLGSLTFSQLSTYSNMFSGVPSDCLIIVKDDEQKSWLQTNFSNLTNIQTVEEYETA